MKTACACLLACMAAGASEQPDDPLKAPACAQALERLHSARNGGADAVVLEGWRSATATICLGSAAPPQRPGRVTQPPVAVPPPQIDLPVRVAPLPPTVLPPPPLAIGRPASPALCDAGGCWANDGTHLRQVGPSLLGPTGACTRQGALISCP